MSLAKELMKFAMATLPDLISKFGEDGALDELARLWKEYRSTPDAKPGANLQSKAEEVTKDRADVDKRLEERRAHEESTQETRSQGSRRKAGSRKKGS